LYCILDGIKKGYKLFMTNLLNVKNAIYLANSTVDTLEMEKDLEKGNNEEIE
jgi:hypothetical protein